MSKVHQAIQKVARQNKPDQATTEQNFLEDLEQDFIHSLNRTNLNAEDPPRLRSKKSSPPEGHPGEPADLPAGAKAKLISLSAPGSFASEQYRALKAKLYQMRNVINLKTILITSAVAQEGKTLTAVNLALVMAQEFQQKILLVDADLRRPSVHKVLGFSAEKGLADFLGQHSSMADVLLKTRFHDLLIVPAGTVRDKPTELLNTPRMREFLASAAERFDWVILDSPPLILADAELLSSLADGVLMVVRACETPEHLIVKAVQTLKGKNVLGFVFNGTKAKKKSKYHYYPEV
jgi:protein-tyrosine kinase